MNWKLSHFSALCWLACCLCLSPVAQTNRDTVALRPDDTQSFTIVALPDTQFLAEQSRGATLAMFNAETEWACRNRVKENVKVVVGLGDIVNIAGSSAQWERASSAYGILDGCGIPYAPTEGNHDVGMMGFFSRVLPPIFGRGPSVSYTKSSKELYEDIDRNGGYVSLPDKRDAENYNKYFGPSRLSKYSWYGKNTFPAGSNENFYITFTAGEKQYLVIALEFFPRTAALNWAQKVIDANPDKLVIIATHAYLAWNHRLQTGGFTGPWLYGLYGDDGNSGEDMWNKLVRKNKNIIMVLSGHIPNEEGGGVGRRTDLGDNGNTIQEMVSCYHWMTSNSGEGFIRILKVRPAAGVIEVKTYSPYLNEYKTDDGNQFTLSIPGTH